MILSYTIERLANTLGRVMYMKIQVDPEYKHLTHEDKIEVLQEASNYCLRALLQDAGK